MKLEVIPFVVKPSSELSFVDEEEVIVSDVSFNSKFTWVDEFEVS